MKKSLVTAPTGTPISLAEAKIHLIVEHSDDDTLISAYISQAVEFVEQYTGLFLMPQTWRYHFDCIIGDELEIEAYNVLTVESVSHKQASGITIDLLTEVGVLGVYYIDKNSKPFRISPIDSWPEMYSEGYNNFSVELISGYTDAASVPNGIKTALYLMVGHLYRNRESTTAVQMKTLPLGVYDFINKYRVYDL